MEAGQRVKWNETGEFGTVKWVTKRGWFAVDWDSGQYVEYDPNSDYLVSTVL